MSTIVIDFETRSEADLRKVGPWAYSEHPSTEIICLTWTRHDWPKGRFVGWRSKKFGGADAIPFDLADAIKDGALFEAHNAAFEYSIWENVLHKRMRWPRLASERWRDTMALACYYSLPAALDNLCRVLGLPGKDPAGGVLIQKYSKLYLKNAKREIPPEDMDRWVRYCGRDTLQERNVGELLGELPEPEEAIFLHDFEVATRGLRIDRPGVLRARKIVEQRSVELEQEFHSLTGINPSQVGKILAWLAKEGLVLENLQKNTIADFLEGPEAPRGKLRRALELRLQHARASTKKLDAMLAQCGSDGRARFQTRYHGAATGRNTGSGFQPLNLVRNWDGMDPEQLVRDIGYGDPKWLDALYGDAMDAVAKASRYWITASEGRRVMAGDFSSIEAVVNACLAGEEWKIQLFRDRGDPYCTFASKVVGREVLPKSDPRCSLQDKADRQNIGKPGELAFGYQGAVGAWRKFDRSDAFTDEDIVSFVRAWRDLHPNIYGSWRGLEDACIEAVSSPGRTTGYRQIGFERVDGWLTMILPNGKRLWYWAPQLRLTMPRWHDPEVSEDCAAGTCDCEPRPQVHYMAQKEGQWRSTPTYGGKLCENAVQATSRELLKPAELAIEAAGYPVVLSVYDEIVCDVPNNFGSAKEFSEIVAEAIAGLDWARGWPIRMDEPWEGNRYKKA